MRYTGSQWTTRISHLVDLVLTATFDGQERNFNEDDPVPAIVIEEEVEAEEDSAWTYRFLIPTSVAIAVLVIIGNVIQYFRQVTRKRYKVIEK